VRQRLRDSYKWIEQTSSLGRARFEKESISFCSALSCTTNGRRALESLGRSPMPRDERTRLGDCLRQRIGVARPDLGQQEGAGICRSGVCAKSVSSGRLRSTACPRGSWRRRQLTKSALYVGAE